MQFSLFRIVIALAVLPLISAVAPPSQAQSSNMRVKEKTQPMVTTPSTPSMKGEPTKRQVEKATPKPKKGEQVPRQMLRGRM
jgi:hypothetical protein